MSAVRSAAHPPVRLVPISPAALQPPSAVVKMNCPPALQYRTQLFSLSLYPLHARIDQPRQNRMPPVLGPPWLPFPPSPDTHNARHIRRYRELMYDIEHKTPRLYASILISKKRVHKHAVVRNRCRTRLMAALQQLIRREKDMPVHSCTYDCTYVPVHAYIFFGTSYLFSAESVVIEQEVRRALLAVGSKALRLTARHPSLSKPL